MASAAADLAAHTHAQPPTPSANAEAAPVAAAAETAERYIHGVPVSALSRVCAAMVAEDELRETLIKSARDAQRSGKHAVYALHRGDTAAAREYIASARELLSTRLLPLLASAPGLRYGALSGALEEWAEAVIFEGYLRDGRVPSMEEVGLVNKEEYLGGLIDFTGELNRYAVLRATARDVPTVRECRDLVDTLMHSLMEFNWRNGALRRKYDSMKYTLRKLEQMCYELSITSSAGFMPTSGAEVPPVPVEGAEGGEDGGAPADDGGGMELVDEGSGGGFSRGGRRGGLGGGYGGSKRPRGSWNNAGPNRT